MMRILRCIQVVYDLCVLGYVANKNNEGEENRLIVPRGRSFMHLLRWQSAVIPSPANELALCHLDRSIHMTCWLRPVFVSELESRFFQ